MDRIGFASGAWLLVAVLSMGGCSVDRSGLATGDAGPKPGDGDATTDGRPPVDADGLRDTGTADTGPGVDGGGAEDAGVDDACVPSTETCNDRDDDCDGTVDEDASDASTWYEDGDGDGFGADASTMVSCDPPGADYVAVGGDCDDAAAAVHPDAVETCNGIDDDCTGLVDDEEADCPCRHRRRGLDDRSYLFCSRNWTWASGRGLCEDYGYDLVVIADLDENDWVWNTASAISGQDWWIGLREVSSGTLEWVDGSIAWSGGSSSGFTRFRDGYPDGSGPCVEMGDDVVDGHAGAWNDVSCSQETGFVCEQR